MAKKLSHSLQNHGGACGSRKEDHYYKREFRTVLQAHSKVLDGKWIHRDAVNSTYRVDSDWSNATHVASQKVILPSDCKSLA